MAQQNNRARQRSRQRITIILILVVLGAGAFFLFSGNDDKVKKRVKRPEPKGMVKVPTLKKNVGPGTRLSKKLIRTTYKSPREVPTDAILASDQYIGRYTTTPILEGQYIRESFVSADGAVGRFSAMARPGMRLVVLNAKLFPGSINTLKVGDRIDILAFEGSKTIARRGRGSSNVNSGAVHGNQPGSGGNTRKRSRRVKRNSSAMLQDPGTLSATLIAENAEVMSVPMARRGKNISGHNALVLQMQPQDAHITTLMAANNTQMRAVFRPYGDDTRLTQPKQVSVTTRLPKPLPDPDVVNLIVNGQTYQQKPNSTIYSDREASVDPSNQPKMIYGRKKLDVNITDSDDVTSSKTDQVDVSAFDPN